MRIAPSGNVGIGTTIANSKLTVNGNLQVIDSESSWELGFGVNGDPVRFLSVDVINSPVDTDPLELVYGRGTGVQIGRPDAPKFLKVYGASGAYHWPDYVFEDSYELNELEQVEKYIEKNHHLPEIPSAAEVKENGIDIVQMQAKLLQKIEELTLYVIEQNKKLESQNKRIEIQSRSIQNQQKEIEQLKTKQLSKPVSK